MPKRGGNAKEQAARKAAKSCQYNSVDPVTGRFSKNGGFDYEDLFVEEGLIDEEDYGENGSSSSNSMGSESRSSGSSSSNNNSSGLSALVTASCLWVLKLRISYLRQELHVKGGSQINI